MSFCSAGVRILLLAVGATFLMAATMNAADPKVVKASHEPDTKVTSEDTAETEEEGISYSPQWPEPPNTGALLMRLCVGTVVVLGLCVVVLWFGKPWLQKLQVAGSGSSAFQIEGSVAVGNRAMLYLVKVGETQLVAGTDASGLKSLIALTQSFKETLDEQVSEPASTPSLATTSASFHAPLPFNARATKRPDSKE